MSVGKNSFGLAPYYEWKSYNASNNGLGLSTVKACASSPTIAFAHGLTTTDGTNFLYTGFKSTDGINWSSVSSAPNSAITGIAYGNGVFVAVGFSGVIYTAPGTNVDTWTARTKAGTSSSNFYNVFFVNGKFYALQSGNNWQSSSDGITWAIEVSGGQYTYNANVDSDQDDGPFFPSMIQEDGVNIFFTGETAGTTSVRIAIKATSSTATTYTGVTTPVPFLYGRPDIGDGLGPLVQQYSSGVGSVNPFALLQRSMGTHVGGAFNSQIIAGINNDDRLNKIPIFAKNTGVSGGVDTTSLACRIPIYYTDGWYNIIFPGTIPTRDTTVGYPAKATGFGNNVLQYALMNMRYHERDLHDYPVPEVRNKILNAIIYPYLTTNSSRIATGLRRSHPFKLNETEFILMGRLNGLGSVDGGNIVLKSSRAFKPIMTTIG